MDNAHPVIKKAHFVFRALIHWQFLIKKMVNVLAQANFLKKIVVGSVNNVIKLVKIALDLYQLIAILVMIMLNYLLTMSVYAKMAFSITSDFSNVINAAHNAKLALKAL